MLILNNVDTTNAYPTQQGSGASLGPSMSGLSLNLASFNASAVVQLIVPDNADLGAQAGWHYLDEMLMTPQTQTWNGAIGFRARSYAAGVPATLFATVTEKADPQALGGVPLTEQVIGGQFALASELTGIIDSTGATIAGTGFSSVRNALGNYTITFATPYASTPDILLTAERTAGVGVIANYQGASSTGFSVIIVGDTGGALDADFHFRTRAIL